MTSSPPFQIDQPNLIYLIFDFIEDKNISLNNQQSKQIKKDDLIDNVSYILLIFNL